MIENGNELFSRELLAERGKAPQIAHQDGNVLCLAAALLSFLGGKNVIRDLGGCIPDKCGIDFEKLSKICNNNEIDDLRLIVAGHPYMEVAYFTRVVDVINDGFMSRNLIGDRIDKQLDKIVIAFNERNGLPDLYLTVGRDLKESLGRRICI